MYQVAGRYFCQLLTLVWYLRRAGKGGVLSATRAIHNRAAAYVAADGGIFENQLQAPINSN